MIRTVYREKPDDWAELTEAVREDTLQRAVVVVDQASDKLHGEVSRRLRQRRGEAAPAGEPPAMQTGELARAFAAMRAKIGRRRNRVTGGLHTPNRKRANGEDWWPVIGALEYGATVNGVHHPARPFLRPSEDVVQREVDRLLAGEM
jgi:hypothetical protein